MRFSEWEFSRHAGFLGLLGAFWGFLGHFSHALFRDTGDVNASASADENASERMNCKLRKL
jgi:hypothetical protein